MTKPNQQHNSEKLGLFSVVKSVAAAMFGVQSHANRERDFNQKSILPYAVVGIIFVLLFVVTLVAIVNAVVA